jgi:UDP-glucose 4-epimerase
MTTSLVTGAAGFIGFALARKLAEDPQHRVIVVDNFVRGERDEAFAELCKQENVEFLELDLSAPDAIDRLPAVSLDYLFHLAALNGTQNFYERPYDVVRHSTMPLFTLVERYLRTKSVGRLVYAGSSEAYAGTVSKFGWTVPTAENVPLCISDPKNVRWSYGGSKLHGEILACAAAAQFGTAYTVIRYHNVYGPRMGDKHVIPDFINRMKQGVYALYGHADTRCFMYIDDAVDATMRLARAPAGANEIVNVGSDEELTMEDLGRRILSVARKNERIELHPSPPGSVARRVPDLAKLRSITGFEAAWSLDRGLEATLSWYLAH